MFYIYILYSESADKYYVGYTSDLERRIGQHNYSDRNTFTSKFRPWIIAAAFEAGKVESEAIRIERFIKKQKSRKLIKRMVQREPLNGVLAQLVRVPQLRD